MLMRRFAWVIAGFSPLRWGRGALPKATVILFFMGQAKSQVLVQTIPPLPFPAAPLTTGFCSVGDVNADGVPDLATGHPLLGPPGVGLGAVRMYAGGSGAVLGERTAVSFGVTDRTGFGYPLETLGDVTGDGIPEFLAGIPISSNLSGLPVPGLVLIISPVGLNLIAMLTGFEPADQFGMGLGGLTDVNGDGIPDPLIGAPTAGPGGLTFAGQAAVVDGLTTAVLLTLPGSSSGDTLGRHFAPMGDIDGDGNDDFAVDHFIPSWEAIVISGGGNQLLYPVAGPISWNMSSIEDLDFDGNRELVTRSGYAGLEGVTVFSSGNPILSYTVPPVTNLANFGLSIDSAGDVDGDGFEDIVVGADASVPPGGGPGGYGAVVLVSGGTGSLLHQINGPNNGGGMGSQVRGLGDMNGDGLSDIAARNAGHVEIWSLVPAGVSIDGTACPGSGGVRPVIGMTGIPVVGSSVSVNISRVPQPATALLLFGPAASSWLGIPLPLDLAVVGLPGCNLAVPPDVIVPVMTVPRPGSGIGGATQLVAIPPDPTLLGASVAFQWYAPDPGPSAFPGVTTRRLVATILP